ncbi:MAG TPA: hypothetical protein VJT49_14660 [Amycolatopsis sp.]|uniref:hypothetical protein n=1 Tax=Amycolatopsis sp. TaxID=37632 RepID=UPI002B4A3108|nr:hypothetical protein [Amycolatopsis sp.]HKS46321.1 hypothetical protein [Amycolatopsis sp.]
MIKTALANLLTTKLAVAGAAAAAVTVGGVVAVAATGGLPGGGSGAPSAPSAGASSAASSSQAESTQGRPADTTGTGRPSETPSPSLTGLCHAYTAGAGSDHGKALENPAFTVLITTAGGKDKVDGYCAELLATPSDAVTTTTKNGHTEIHATQDPEAHAPSIPAHPSH